MKRPRVPQSLKCAGVATATAFGLYVGALIPTKIMDTIHAICGIPEEIRGLDNFDLIPNPWRMG